MSAIAYRTSSTRATNHGVLRIRDALSCLRGIPGLSVFIRTDAGVEILLNGQEQEAAPFGIPEAVSTQRLEGEICIDLDDTGRLFIHDSNPGKVVLRLAEVIVQKTLGQLAVERREESLLEELSASWESLEALYEISTDALRSVNINETLKRLIDRLVSIQGGLHATLFVGRRGHFESLVSTEHEVATVSPAQLGPIKKVIEHGQTVTLPYAASIPPSNVCWNNASVIAAAPITLRQEPIGFLILWSAELDFAFDSAYLRLLEAIAYQASILMERDRLNRKIRDSDLLAQEIEIASFIQQTLLLANSPKNVPGMKIAACSLPSQHIDGDFYDFLQHPNGNLDVIVGDVMGKGVAAALLGAAVKSQILRSIANLALRSTSGTPNPEEIVRRAASRMSEQLVSLERFVTMCYARFDMQANLLHLVDCGHTSTILSRSGQDCVFLQGEDLPLGVLEPYNCTGHSFPIRRGDTYFFYSDGVTENRSSDGELFGTERLSECVQNWSSLGPALLVGQIRREAEKFSRPAPFADDFTCIAVRISISSADQQPLLSSLASFAAKLEELSEFRVWLNGVSAGQGACLTEDGAARMELACTELFVNFAMHSQFLDSPVPIQVECAIYESYVTVRMIHPGPEFDPLSIPPPTFDGSRDNGFGTYIVLRSADEVKYERDPNGINIITVSFLGSEA